MGTSSRTTARRGPVLDWAAGHGPVTGALSATTGAYALATTGAATGMPPGWALTVGAAGAVGHTAAGLRWRNTGRTIATRAATWLVGAGWTTWAMATGPLTWAALGSLATLGAGMATATRSSHLHEEAIDAEKRDAQQRAIAAELSAERRAIAAEWIERIQRVCGVPVRVLAVEKWEAGTGFTLDVEPAGGITYDHIARHAPRLSADAQLPHGCTVSALPGIHQGRALIDIGTTNVLADEVPYPSDYGPVSLLTGLPWGVRSTGETVNVYLREQCALLVGPTGSGKTNTLHTIIAGFARATDVLTWVIDLNAGSAGLPWVRPALTPDGTMSEEVHPGIDWLAGTHDEAFVMLDTLLDIARHRKTSYQELLAQKNTDLLPVSHHIPQIMLIIDEGAEILTSTDRTVRKLAGRILEIIRIARAMGVRTVLTALGATGSVLGNLMIRREAKVRAALTGGETEGMDLSKMFPGRKGLRVDQAPYKGSGFLGTPESPATLWKAWRILPNQIGDIVRATSARRPVLDSVSAKVAGPRYADRWSPHRLAWMHNHHPTGPTPAAASPPASGLNLSALRKDPAEPAPDADALAAEFMRQIDQRFGTTDEPNPTPASERPQLNLSALRNDPTPPPETGPEWLPDAITAIKNAGPAGMKPAAIADLVGRSRQAVRGALKAAATRGELIYRDNGPHSVYVHPTYA